MGSTSLHQSELWEISRQLVSFDTVSSNSNLLAAQYLVHELENSGFHTHLMREQIDGVEKAMVVAWAGPAVADGLIISGHIDVVPFEGQPGWRSDPLILHSDDEYIYGRGVTDMKVFLAQMILAARQHDLTKLKHPLIYLLTCDEEVAGQGSARLLPLLPKILSDIPIPKVAFIGEPTDFGVFPAHKGYACFDISVQGKGGHSSIPAKGLNAIEKMSDVIRLIQETQQRLQEHISSENQLLFPDNPTSTFNLGTISGGLAANMIAETCQMTVSLRTTPGDDAEEIINTLRQRVEREVLQPMQALFAESSIHLEQSVAIPPLHSPGEHPFCQLLCQILQTSATEGISFATDGGHFREIDIDSYICGPGLLSEAHQPNERIPIANFLRGQKYIEQVISEWCMK